MQSLKCRRIFKTRNKNHPETTEKAYLYFLFFIFGFKCSHVPFDGDSYCIVYKTVSCVGMKCIFSGALLDFLFCFEGFQSAVTIQCTGLLLDATNSIHYTVQLYITCQVQKIS